MGARHENMKSNREARPRSWLKVSVSPKVPAPWNPLPIRYCELPPLLAPRLGLGGALSWE